MHSDQSVKPLPFNNLFLNSAAVHGFNYWWMYVLGITAAFFGYLLFQVIIQIPLMAIAFKNNITLSELTQNPNLIFDPDKMGIDRNVILALLLGMFVFALAGLFIVVKRVHKKPFMSIITAYSKLRYKRFFVAFSVWGSLVFISVFVSYFIDSSQVIVQFKPAKFLILFLVCVFLMPIQTSTEEILIRGYLMQGLALLFKNGIIPLILTSLLFGMLHMENPEAKTFGWQIMLPYYSLFGLFLGIITLLDEGLELALGIHCANNLISSLLVTSPTGVLKTDSVFLVHSDDPASELLLWVGMATITFIIFWLIYKWKNFNLILK
ncbi:MAG: CPBP family intramembrane metalloprotease [Bacteroidetes bacterium]|nr:CPBP family intramembrane metalloprotease [Bacteroidota bacterium]